MGNSASSGRGHHEEMVDFGYLTPQGIYTGPRDWNQAVVTQLIVERKLAPFYRPLEDYDDSWDDEQILAARKEPADVEGGEPSRAESITSVVSSRGHQKRPSAAKEPARNPEAAIYRGATECPICFLYYPPNINRSRCCDQAICTECFVQIKRADPTTTHLVSEPASCPYCVQENFGIVYTPPPWRTGLGSEGATPPSWPDSPRGTSQQSLDAVANPSMKRRRKSFGANDPEVVTVDQIHPDWEAKLAAVRAAVARRANRRIIMRQVGDRLIPVGVTSGRVHALPPEEAGAEVPEGSSDRGSRRSRRRQQNQELNQFLGTMGLGGQDLEELMVMEAMRLSLLEHEEQQRRQREEEAKKQREEAAAEGGSTEAVDGPTDAGAPSQLASNDTTPPALQPTTSESPGQSVPPASPSPLSSGSASPADVDHEQTSGPGVPASGAPELRASTGVGPTAQSRPRTPLPAPTTDGVPLIAEAITNDEGVQAAPPGSSVAHASSMASSLATSSYDVLPSSPESALSNKPLLDAAGAATAPASDDASSAAQVS
ncbi:hypothetical protein C8Q77DRAFT_1215944 [Trametes polyzona]|nr:hypothetical protein C8Q77DRAFT_1215944 [Trametes polyzona]